MFHIKGHQSAQQAAEHRMSFHFKGRLGSQYPHFLSTIGTRVLHSFQHHPSPVSHESKHSGIVSSGRCVPAWRGDEENRTGPVRRQAPRTERPEGQRGVDRDQLAVLGLLDPERGKPQARYGLAQLSPEETLGALALEGLHADNLRPISDLAPWESLAAFGLIDGGEIA
jgi:hypothetical protein